MGIGTSLVGTRIGVGTSPWKARIFNVVPDNLVLAGGVVPASSAATVVVPAIPPSVPGEGWLTFARSGTAVGTNQILECT